MLATRRRTALAVLGAAAVIGAAITVPAAAHGRPALAFGKPVYVSHSLAGGEPLVMESSKTHTLLYTAHEGTTHLFRDGLVASPNGDADFVGTYRNQVVMWTSTDGGKTWAPVDWQGTGFYTDPSENSGFSDPDLTEDAGGTIYNTGINLANDALFSSPDGGKTWPAGTVNCHNGDRPWLAGGKAGEVFLATDTLEGPGSGHEVFHSTDSGASCDQTGIPDTGDLADGGTYTGFGKLYYDHRSGRLVEPVIFSHPSNRTGLGIAVLPDASHAWDDPANAHFTAYQGVPATSIKGHWPAIAIDRAGTVYLVWDTDDRRPGTTGGCSGAETPAANSIKMTWTRDGRHWARPVTVAHPGTTVLWPWVAAGDAGKVSVVWYQYDKVVDPDCATDGKVSAMAATFLGLGHGRPRTAYADVFGRPVHEGGICQGGTTCVVTGQDRRLGDFFTNALDRRGCVLVASGDTMLTDPDTGAALPTARPLFARQVSGWSLYGGRCDR